MDITLWIIQWILAVLSGFWGLIKIFIRPEEIPWALKIELIRSEGIPWHMKIRLTGVIGVVMAIGLIWPLFTPNYPIVVPISAAVLFCFQLMGILMAEGETKKSSAIINFLVLLFTAFIIYGRYFYNK